MHLYICIYMYRIFISRISGIVETSQKCDEAKVEQWIKKIPKDALDRQGGSRKNRGQIETLLLLLNRDFVYYYEGFYFY